MLIQLDLAPHNKTRGTLVHHTVSILSPLHVGKGSRLCRNVFGCCRVSRVWFWMIGRYGFSGFPAGAG